MEKPWLEQDIPELSGPSHNDVCFKAEGLCVIYLKKGAITDDESNMLSRLKQSFTSNLAGRGTVFKWMWMDLATETEFTKLFQASPLPNAVVFNPHKRLRFTKLPEDTAASKVSISNLIETVLGGDARFKMVKGQKLPSFTLRSTGNDKKGKKEL